MKKAIHVADYNCLNLAFLQKLKEHGFDGIAFEFSKAFNTRPDKDQALNQIIENIQAAGLTCPQVHLPYYDIFASSETYDPEMEDHITYALRAMAKLGAKWGALHPMSASNFGYDRKKAMEDNIEHIKKYLETASKYNVGIAVENLPYFPDHPEAPFFSSHTEDLRELVDRIDNPLVGVCWDFGHAHVNMTEGQDELSSLKTVADKVTALHVHNNYTNVDWHLCLAFGDIKWEEVLPVLFDAGYDGYFTLESSYGRRNKTIESAYLRFTARAADIILKSVGK